MRKYLVATAMLLVLLIGALLVVSWAKAKHMATYLEEFRPVGGVNNNLLRPELNAVPDAPELAIAPLNFANPTTLEMIDGPNPRTISNRIAGAAGTNGDDAQTTDPVASAWLYVFGQFVDHDLSLEIASPASQAIPIAVPSGDPVFKDGTVIDVLRDGRSPVTKTIINTVAGYLDLSQLYGSTPARALALRDGDGLLNSSHDGQALSIVDGRFVSGDVRVSENPEITAVTTLFMREHNYWVRTLREQHAGWSGGQLYDMAKAITTAEYQNIIYNEFLPLLIGPVIKPYVGYDSRINPQVTQEFTTGAFRVGHTQVSETQSGIDNDGKVTYSQSLAQAFFNTPEETLANGLNALMRNVTNEYAQATDVYTVPVLRNLLFAPLQGGGTDQFDLIAIDIQRGRDVGLGSLNQTRKALGLTPYITFAELTDDVALQLALKSVYGEVGRIDLFMGGLAERHAGGAVVGETFQAIIKRQFIALRDGDRFFWRNQGFDPATIKIIGETRLSNILRRNTDSTNVPDNVFVGHAASPPRRNPHAPASPIDNHGRLGRPFSAP
jgi:peroxidase